jgi:hypothetical protein
VRTTTTIRTSDPNGVALAAMSRAAVEAARQWTMQEWAGRLAARAQPRDYVGQLEQLYHGIIERWRYVKEPGERVPGNADALLGTVLGCDYNRGPRCPSNHQCDVEGTQWRECGWGDCDDVAALTAAGALAMGMRPYFRIVPGHVSVVVETPRGEYVSLDPVGHPDHPFGWAAPGPAQHYPVANEATMQPFAGNPTGQYHFAAVPEHDNLGPRILAMPGWAARYFRAGLAIDNTPAVDQFGRGWRYDGPTDTWVPAGQVAPVAAYVQQQLAGLPFGAVRRRPPGVRLRRRRNVGRVLRRIVRGVQNVGRKVANVGGQISRNPVLRELVAQGGQAFGVPPQVTRGVMKGAGALNQRTGGRFLSLVRRDPRAALSTAAQAAAAAASGVSTPFGCVELHQMGGVYHAAPVLGFVGVDGVHAFGALDIAAEPTPGQYYRIKHGDTLLGVAGRAYDVPAGATRLERSKWINNAQVNRVYWVPPKKAFNVEHYPQGIIYFAPEFAADPEAALRGEVGKS